MIRVSNLKKEYNLPNGKKVLALEHVNLDFEEAGLSIIRGKSGSGKSTLLNLLAGLDRITDGEIRINNLLGESNVPLIYVKPQILFMAGAFIILMSGIIAMIPIRKFSKQNLVTLLKQ